MIASLLRGFSYWWSHTHKWSLWSDVVPHEIKPDKFVMGRWRTCELCGKREFKKVKVIVPPKPL